MSRKGWAIAVADRLKAAGRTDPKLLRAAKLLEWLQGQPDGKANFREMLQFGPFRTKATAEASLTILAAHNLIIEVSKRPRVIRVVPLRTISHSNSVNRRAPLLQLLHLRRFMPSPLKA
jgi:hypothetical protein